jgi:hypothetical protein
MPLRTEKFLGLAKQDQQQKLTGSYNLMISFCCSCNNINLSITEVGHLFSSKRLRAINMCPVLFIALHIMFNFI